MNSSALENVADRLDNYVESFAQVFGRSERRKWCGVYVSGLILSGERKSIEPIASRLKGGNVQALQQFVNQSPWDGFELQSALRKDMIKRFKVKAPIVVLDDTSLPKKGKKSVGVSHQYCGALGKLSNCQSLVSLQAVAPRAHFPLNARLYLPESWCDEPERVVAAGVPEKNRTFKEKWVIALELIDEAIRDCKPSALVTDSGYGNNKKFLAALDERQIDFAAYCRPDTTFWDANLPTFSTSNPRGTGRPPKYAQPQDRKEVPYTAKEWAEEAFSDRRRIRTTTIPHQTPILAEYVAIRVKESVRGSTKPRIGLERWLIVERLKDDTFQYIVSSFSEKTKPAEIIRMAHQRYKVEQGYQQLKEELGLDHFEGRSWQGLHHHIALCFMAYNFLQIIARSKGNGKKNAPSAN